MDARMDEEGTVATGGSGEVWQIGHCRVDVDGLQISGPAGETLVEPKVMAVLAVLVAHRGEVVPRQALIDAVWQTEFGGDESLTRAISLLRKALGDHHGTRMAIETVPRRGYRLIADVGACAETERPPRPAEAAAGAARPATPWRALALIAASVVAVTAIILAVRAGSTPTLPVPDAEIVASGRVDVEPFSIVGSDPALADFAATLAPTLTARLTEAGIETAPTRTQSHVRSEFRLAGQVESANAAHRVQFELVDEVDGVVIWSGTVRREAAQADSLRDQIASMISATLQCMAHFRNGRLNLPSETLRVFASYCAAQRSNNFHLNRLPRARALIAADPDSPKAMAVYAWALVDQARDGSSLSEETREDMIEEARAVIERAAELAPEDANVNAALTRVFALNGSLAEVEARLVELVSTTEAPAVAQHSLAHLYRETGRLWDALYVYKDTLAMYPRDTFARTRHALISAMVGDRTGAHRQLDQVEREDPDWKEGRQRRVDIELFSGDPVRALGYLEAPEDEAYHTDEAHLRCLRAFAGARLEAEPDVDAVYEACPYMVQADRRARIFSALGDLDRAFAAFAELPDKETNVRVVFWYPEMDAFRKDPRFWAEADRFGLVDYWIDTGRMPDFCEDPELSFDCMARAREISELDRASQGAAEEAELAPIPINARGGPRPDPDAADDVQNPAEPACRPEGATGQGDGGAVTCGQEPVR